LNEAPTRSPEIPAPSEPAGFLLLLLTVAGWITSAIIQPVLNLFDYTGRLLMLAAQAVYYIVTLRIPVSLTLLQMSHLGADSLLIVILCLGFTGMIFATIIAQQAVTLGFGSQYVGGAVVWAMAKDLGPVLGALVLAGRVGAGIASEIGTMVVTEQVDALRALAVPPVRHLVVPRLIACAVMIPAITFIAGFIGVWAGWLPLGYSQFLATWASSAGKPIEHISHRMYFDSVFTLLKPDLLRTTFHKSLIFGVIISLVACQEGFATRGGARGVGVTVTRAVVISMVCVFIADLILTL
jgi:phospholipid/cholesterol/gamma-HCH transport system permease protein